MYDQNNGISFQTIKFHGTYGEAVEIGRTHLRSKPKIQNQPSKSPTFLQSRTQKTVDRALELEERTQIQKLRERDLSAKESERAQRRYLVI